MFRGASLLNGRYGFLVKWIPGAVFFPRKISGDRLGGFQWLLIFVFLKHAREERARRGASFHDSLRESVRYFRLGGYLGMLVVALF